jgi:ribokinase
MIVVFGSVNIDVVVPVERLPRPGETVLGPAYRLVPGGKGANQALAARRAGGAVHLIGRVGRDGFSDVALADLREAGVDLSALLADELPTGCALIPVDGEGQNLIVVASGANRLATESQVPDALLDSSAVVVLQMEVPLAENWRLVRRAKARGARVLLNCAPVALVPHGSLAALDWLVVNESEAELLARSLNLAFDGPREAGRAIARSVGITVIVTLGGEGAVAYAGAAAWAIGALPIKPVDTTAAGDAFVGGFAVAMADGADLPTALHWASVAGGLACTVAGAQPSLPTKAMIDARLADLTLPQRT